MSVWGWIYTQVFLWSLACSCFDIAVFFWVCVLIFPVTRVTFYDRVLLLFLLLISPPFFFIWNFMLILGSVLRKGKERSLSHASILFTLLSSELVLGVLKFLGVSQVVWSRKGCHYFLGLQFGRYPERTPNPLELQLILFSESLFPWNWKLYCFSVFLIRWGQKWYCPLGFPLPFDLKWFSSPLNYNPEVGIGNEVAKQLSFRVSTLLLTERTPL